MLKRIIRVIKNLTNPAAIILMYHRIDKEGMDPWGLCVTPQHFAEQLDIIKRHANPISLETFIENLRHNKIIPNSVVVTFDDGYLNNLTYAKPLLEKYEIPATFYITTGMVNGTREFWWDELEQILLKPGKLPDELILEIAGVKHRWDLGKAANYTEKEYKNDFHLKPWESQKESRLNIYYTIWQHLQPLQETERVKIIQTISQWSNSDLLLRDSHRILNVTELLELNKNELFEIGAHSDKHPSLPKLNKAQQTQEILCSKVSLEKILQHTIDSFAYPHGEYSKETVDILQSAGFQNACTTDETLNLQKRNFFELTRFQVEDWNGETFRKILNNQYMTY